MPVKQMQEVDDFVVTCPVCGEDMKVIDADFRYPSPQGKWIMRLTLKLECLRAKAHKGVEEDAKKKDDLTPNGVHKRKDDAQDQSHNPI